MTQAREGERVIKLKNSKEQPCLHIRRDIRLDIFMYGGVGISLKEEKIKVNEKETF